MPREIVEIEYTEQEAQEFLVREGFTCRGPGRPRGTGLRRLDEPFHQRMRQLLDGGFVSSRTQAAWKVAEHAPGGGTLESKVDRLVRTYPY